MDAFDGRMSYFGIIWFFKKNPTGGGHLECKRSLLVLWIRTHSKILQSYVTYRNNHLYPLIIFVRAMVIYEFIITYTCAPKSQYHPQVFVLFCFEF